MCALDENQIEDKTKDILGNLFYFHIIYDISRIIQVTFILKRLKMLAERYIYDKFYLSWF